MGNSLKNLSLLLKPQIIRETPTEIQKGKEGTVFKKRAYNNERDDRIMSRADYFYDISYRYYKDDRIKIHDFINVFPYMKENLIPDKNGLIIIKDLNLEEYSFLHILCFDNKSCNEDWFYLKNG